MILVSPGIASSLLTRVGFALTLSQGGVGALVGASRRTVSRWVACDTSPQASQLLQLVPHVYPRDAGLAAEIAAACHETLESLGIVAPPPASPPAPPGPPALPPALVVDLVVCAAAEAMSGTPQAVRHVLLAAFTRAKAVGLTVDDVIGALEPPKASKTSRAAAQT